MFYLFGVSYKRQVWWGRRGGGGGWGGRIPRTVPLDLPLELTEEYIIKAVFICVQEHWESDTEKTNGSF